jgi:hypothetical protein
VNKLWKMKASYRPLSYGNTDLLSLAGTTFCLLPARKMRNGSKQLGLSLVVTATLHSAFTGVVSSLLLCSMENGRWLQASHSSFIVIADLCCAH